VGHLKGHGVVVSDVMLHWLFPSKDLENGLRVLHDDKACQDIAYCITDNGVADVFVESMSMQLQAIGGECQK